MEPEKKSNGALIGIVVIIIILVIAGIYMWSSNPTPDTSETINNQNSAELDKLEADLQATDINTGVDINSVN